MSSWGTSLEPIRVRISQLRFELSHLWQNATLAFWKWNINVMFWHSLWLNEDVAFWRREAQFNSQWLLCLNAIVLFLWHLWLKASIAFGAYCTAFSFCLLTVSSTLSSTVSNSLGSRELLRTPYKLSLLVSKWTVSLAFRSLGVEVFQQRGG